MNIISQKAKVNFLSTFSKWQGQEFAKDKKTIHETTEQQNHLDLKNLTN